MRTSIIMITIACLAAGCATHLEPGAEKVRIITAAQKDASCESLGIINAEQSVGPNKQANAMNKAINEVARRGGNGMFVVSAGGIGIDGAAVTAEALRCRT